jgi:hypothetical protein
VAVYTASGNSIVLKQNGDIILSCDTPGGKLRLESDIIEIHANAILKIDCGGTGQRLEPGFIHNYTIGATGDSHNINPPEIPLTG